MRKPPPSLPKAHEQSSDHQAHKGSLRDPRNITELLNYRMARLAAIGGASVIRLCEGKYGVSRREWHLLGLLGAFGAQSPSELTDRSHLDRARVSRAISQLREKRLIGRSQLPDDRRRAKVELTASGRALHHRLFGEIVLINARLLEVLGEDTVALLDDILARLTEQARIVNEQMATDVKADRWRGSGSRRHWPERS